MGGAYRGRTEIGYFHKKRRRGAIFAPRRLFLRCTQKLFFCAVRFAGGANGPCMHGAPLFVRFHALSLWKNMPRKYLTRKNTLFYNKNSSAPFFVDYKAAEEMVDCAMRGGVNYYDTAWGYHNGGSEPALGTFLKNYPRKSYNLATKFPSYDLSNMGKMREIFEKQLEKCGVEYFDYYLMHNVCEMNIDAYLDESYGTYAYLDEQRRAGRIRHLGFSAHGDMPVLRRFLEKYGSGMEFCQLQINWLDWTFQHAKEKVCPQQIDIPAMMKDFAARLAKSE